MATLPAPLKVLQLCAVDFTLAKFLAPLCFYLKGQGFDVTAACTEGEYMAALREQGLRCVNLPIARSMNIFSHARSYRRLSAWLAEEHFDIVHVHTPIASLIGRFASARRHVPIRLYTAHGFYFHDDMPFLKRQMHTNLERVGGWCDHFLFTQSEEDCQSAINLGIAKIEKTRSIGNGIDLGRFTPERFTTEDRRAMRQSLGIAPEARVLGIIGRLVREKGYFELFHAAAQLAKQFEDFRLVVIGGALKSDHDDSSKEMDALVDELGIRDRIIFAGLRSDVPEILNAVDVYTLPSWREGMPRSVIEAMAMGLPAVVTDIRGCREEVLDGTTGYVVPVRNPEALASRCADLLGDPAKARAMGAAGLRRAAEMYSEQKVLERQLEIYEQLIRERGLRR